MSATHRSWRSIPSVRVLILLPALACSSPHGAAFPAAMKEADLATERGDLAEAARRFDAAALVAKLPRDRDDARHAAARALSRAGEVDVALARLDGIAHETPPGVEAASAWYDATVLRLARGETDAGWRDLEEMIHRFPDDGATRPALLRWLDHEDETVGPAATLAWLRRTAPELERTDRAEEIAYETALRLEVTHDATARDAFLAVATRWPYPTGALWDDALWHASEIALAAGDARAAATDLTRMLAARERAILVGSAERSRYAASELRLAELYRDRLADHAAARAAFHALYADFPESSLRDRGLFEEAKLLALDGDGAAACARLETLIEEFPMSRYAPCAVAACPTVHAKPGKDAPSTCHAYVLSQF